MTRATTCYSLVTGVRPDEMHHVADVLKANAEAVVGSVDQTGVNPDNGTAFVRFRTETDDSSALALATRIAGGRGFRLLTGYGVHQREISLMCWHGFRYPTNFWCPVCKEYPVTAAVRDSRV